MATLTKCIINVIGPMGSGKTTLLNSIININSQKESFIYGYTRNWNISEEMFEVNVEIREFNSIEIMLLEKQKDLTFEKEIFIILVGSLLAPFDSAEGHQLWLSDINQTFPNSIAIIIHYRNELRSNLKFEQLRTRYPIVRDVFEVFSLEGEPIRTLATYLKNIILNEFTNRLEFVKEQIRICLTQRVPVLDLGNCFLTSLYEIPQIFECTHLSELILSNEWPEYRNGKWRKVTSNNKGSRNRFRYLPRQLQSLTSLKVLIIGGDWNFSQKEDNSWAIKDINWVKNLSNLEYLNASNNSIFNLPSFDRLRKLRILHLNNNHISKVPNLKKLDKLKEIYLSNNLIENVFFLTELKGIQTIDLHSNNIVDLSILKPQIEKLNISNSKWELNTINVAINPLEQPPIEIINTGKEAVLAYFRDIKLGKPFVNDEIKLILVGNSEVGKTTLAKYLDNENKLDEIHSATLWMDEKRIQSKYKIGKLGYACTINLFDFGGHDYYHDTHHLLFGTNCLYIIIWDKKTNHLDFRTTFQKFGDSEISVQTQDYPLKYWLDSVKYFTKEVESENFAFDSDKVQDFNSHALVIQNKVNSFQDIVHLNNEEIKLSYPFIFDFLNISIINERRNLEYFDTIFTDMLEQGQLIGAKLPGYYGVIKESLNNYSDRPILNIEDFKTYCNSILNSAIDTNQTRFLAHYLKQLGIILFYPKGSNDDKVFLKKEWVIRNIYILFEKLPEKKGEFHENYVFEILKPHLTIDEVTSFIELLMEFKIIFKHPLTNLFIAPLYLPNSPSETVKLFIDDSKIPYRRFIYNGFIHKNITLSLFQEYGQLVFSETKDHHNNFFYYWKDGLIIKDSVTAELILIQFFIGDNEGNAFIDIVKLNKIEKTQFTDNLIAFIKKINQDYDIEEMVTTNGKDFVSLKILNENAKNGKLIFTEASKKDLGITKPNITHYNLNDFIMFLDDGIRKKGLLYLTQKKI